MQIFGRVHHEEQFWERSGSAVEWLTRDREAASLSLTHLSKLRTGLTQEDPSLFNIKIVDGK